MESWETSGASVGRAGGFRGSPETWCVMSLDEEGGRRLCWPSHSVWRSREPGSVSMFSSAEGSRGGSGEHDLLHLTSPLSA